MLILTITYTLYKPGVSIFSTWTILCEFSIFRFQDDAAENGGDCGNVSRQEVCKKCSSPVSFYHFKIKFFNVVEQREVVTSRCHGNKIFGCQQTEN